MKIVLPVLIVLAAAFPAMAQQQGYTPLQQYLYNESGYAPPELGPAPAPVQPYSTAYAPPVAEPDYYYDEEEEEDMGPSAADASLRSMLTSSGN